MAAPTGGAVPYHLKGSVQTAKYHPTVSPRKLPQQGVVQEGMAPMYKTERWRESGASRWPPKAHEEMTKCPSQFSQSQETVPLQRMDIQDLQENVHHELWTRSLRTPGLSIHSHVGPQNQHAFTSAVKCMFNENGVGWTGKTNLGRKIKNVDHKAWVEKPVAVGKYADDHMQGSRYAFDLTPRACVPNSMAHTR
eukprot:gnl/MRDRNA2_/MRDRNA2_148841_c0_seq1.p1 gnl/MRDRNA2_/MRDRNA2_148841_c0~~gnl/MRDRNA2_/MRDRNA2_148841_c0_seq1.p1  ORF type:complete len:194 (-),score=16.89 gnl/MRDRNA2_/MRDRNA2_148841_c0_seq1:4-585(-)